MKKVLNLSALALIIAGASLRILHLPSDGVVITLSSLLIITIILIFAIKENKETGMSNFANYFLSGALAIAVLSASFCGMVKVGAFIIVAISVLINIIVTIYLIFSKEPLKISKQYILSVFLFICLLSSIVAIQELENFKEFIGILISK